MTDAVRLDPGFIDNPRVLALSHGAGMLYVGALCWSAGRGTAGRIGPDDLNELARRLRLRAGGLSALAQLQDVGLWEPDDDGWSIPGYVERYGTESLSEKRRRAGSAGGRARAARLATSSKTPSSNPSKTGPSNQANGVVANKQTAPSKPSKPEAKYPFASFATDDRVGPVGTELSREGLEHPKTPTESPSSSGLTWGRARGKPRQA